MTEKILIKFRKVSVMLRNLSRLGLRRIMADSRGNVFMIMGFAIIPLTASVGMVIDYSRAAKTQTRMNAAADAGALAAVTSPMMSGTTAAAAQAARRMFIAQTSGLSGMVWSPRGTATVTEIANSTVKSYTADYGAYRVVVTDTNNAGLNRVAQIEYDAESQNIFARILGLSRLSIGGTASANSKVAPNIDFYVLLDASQSMLLPATSSGLAAMKAATPTQAGGKGCAFACHQTWRGDASRVGWSAKDPKNNDNEIRNNPRDPDDSNKVLDNYRIAKSLKITLRSDLLIDAISSLTKVAVTTSAANKAVYRMGLSSFDFGFQRLWPQSSSISKVESDLSVVADHAADYTIQPYYVNNWRTSSNNDGDRGTFTSAAFNSMLNVMPAVPGWGTKVAGDTPQAMLFLITDGMRDESRPGGRPEGPIDTNLCTTVKARGIRIAVLYTEYLPESANDSWSVTNVRAPYLDAPDKIGPALENCASPGLYYHVTTDGDISSALNQLFLTAVATAHLTQ